MNPIVLTLTLVAALGCAVVAGAFFAFSAFVMSGLARLPSVQGIAAMQSINLTAVRPAFMTALFGTAALCVVLAATALLTWGDRRALLLLTGSGLYLIGTILLTIGFHVPRNDALAAVDPGGADAAQQWAEYLRTWTRSNHLRATAAVMAAAVFTLALTA